MRTALLAAACLLTSCTAPGLATPATSLDGEWIMASRALRPPTIRFEDDGATGFAGCNRWFAQTTREGDALNFSAAGATRMACPDPEMTIERNFLHVIEQTRAARVSGDTLVLFDDNDREIATFLRAP